jgi:hypothetical protein
LPYQLLEFWQAIPTLFEDAHRSGVLRLGTNEGVESFDGFDVVVVNLWLRVADVLDALPVALEVGGEDFDDAEWVCFVKFANGVGELHRPLVGEVVSGDAGDNDVLQTKVGSDLGNVGGLLRIDGQTTSDFDRTETARSGAGVTEDHEGCGLFAPAFRQVWTASGLTNRVQILLPHHPFDLPNGVGARHANGQPFWQPLVHTYSLRQLNLR